MNITILKNTVVFAKRSEIREAVKSELIKIGAKPVVVVSSSDECIHELFQDRQRVLCLDWAVGDLEAVKVLEALRGKFLIETRPIYVLIPEVSEKTIATAYEYGVSRIQSGQVSTDEIRGDLRALALEAGDHTQLNQALITIAQAREKGEWEASTFLLQELLEKQPDDPRVIVELAENLLHEESWEQAQAVLRPLIEVEDPPVRAIHIMGRCYLKQGDLDGAIGQLQKAKLINPNNVNRLIELGTAFLGIDNIERAMENFSRAKHLAPHNDLATQGLGKCHLVRGEINEALSLLKEHSGPRELASIFNTAAILSIRADRFLKGMALYQAAISATKGDKGVAARLVFNMGIGYRRMDNVDKAYACFCMAVEWDAKFAKAVRNKEWAAAKLIRLGKDPADLINVKVAVSISEAFGDEDSDDDYIAVGEERTSPLDADADLADFDDDLGAA